MKTVALVPVKDLQTAKSRLGPVVDLPGRRRVVLDLMVRGVQALQGAPSVGDIWVVSPDEDVLLEARRMGVHGFAHAGRLNVALEAARQRLAPARLLVALADLPYVVSDDIELLHERLGEQPGIVLAPDEAGQGTNLMLLSPAQAVPFCYGPMSCPRHVAAARERGLAATVVNPGRAGIDIDTPSDLARMSCT